MPEQEVDEYRALLQFRNARRDALYLMHGEKWREYEPNPHGYWEARPLDDDEQNFLMRRRAGKLD